jgi:hypothetical protein
MFKAIVAALKGAFSLLWDLLWLPGRLLGGLFGSPIAPPPSGDSPLMEGLRAELAGRQASLDNHAKVAKAVKNWCVDSIIDDKPAPVPNWLPRDVRAWLPGLTRDEAECVICADKEAISAHVRKLFPMKGVRPASGPRRRSMSSRRRGSCTRLRCDPSHRDAAQGGMELREFGAELLVVLHQLGLQGLAEVDGGHKLIARPALPTLRIELGRGLDGADHGAGDGQRAHGRAGSESAAVETGMAV